MRYTTLLLDLDHTLLDSDASELAAFDTTLRAAGTRDPSAYFSRFVAINKRLWEQVEGGELSPNEVRSRRFEQLVATTDLDVAPAVLADSYVHGLGANGDLLPGALPMLDALAGRASLALVTNGIGEVQRARIERTGIGAYFDAIVISGEIGVSKPARAIFDLTFADLGEPPRGTALMVGDNLVSDMKGGIDFGIDTCWYVTDDARTTDLPITHRVSHLDQIPPIAAGEG